MLGSTPAHVTQQHEVHGRPSYEDTADGSIAVPHLNTNCSPPHSHMTTRISSPTTQMSPPRLHPTSISASKSKPAGASARPPLPAPFRPRSRTPPPLPTPPPPAKPTRASAGTTTPLTHAGRTPRREHLRPRVFSPELRSEATRREQQAGLGHKAAQGARLPPGWRPSCESWAPRCRATERRGDSRG